MRAHVCMHVFVYTCVRLYCICVASVCVFACMQPFVCIYDHIPVCVYIHARL